MFEYEKKNRNRIIIAYCNCLLKFFLPNSEQVQGDIQWKIRKKSFLEINVIQDKTGKLLTIKTNFFFSQTLYNVQFSKSQL